MSSMPSSNFQVSLSRHAWMGPTPPQVNAKCDVVMKLSVFGTRTDRHTHTYAHTRQNLYILAWRAAKTSYRQRLVTRSGFCREVQKKHLGSLRHFVDSAPVLPSSSAADPAVSPTPLPTHGASTTPRCPSRCVDPPPSSAVLRSLCRHPQCLTDQTIFAVRVLALQTHVKADRPITCDTLNAPWLLTNRRFQWTGIMVIHNYHWLNSASQVLILTCSAPLVRTGEHKQLLLFDLDIWPTTLSYNPRLAKVKVDPRARNQVQRSNGSNRRAPTDKRTDTHTHMDAVKRIISPSTRSIINQTMYADKYYRMTQWKPGHRPL